jgi:hypothetical protein
LGIGSLYSGSRNGCHPERNEVESKDLRRSQGAGITQVLRLRSAEPVLSEAEGLHSAHNDNHKQCF